MACGRIRLSTKIIQGISGANSIYNSIVAAVDKRFSHGFSIGVRPYDLRAYRARSEYDVPHRSVLNYVWEVPSPASTALRYIIGGWQTSGIWNWQSGFPLSVTSDVDNSASFTGNDLADLVSTPSLTDGSRGQKIRTWFSTEAFKVNAPGTYGTSSRNILHGPGRFNIDFSAAKSFPIHESLRVQYRLELFNALNHSSLNNPDTSVTSSSFGQIVSAGDPRIMQMALRLVF